MTDRPAPPFEAIPAAWAALPAEERDRLGCMLIEWVLATFVAGDSYAAHNRLCDADIRLSAGDQQDHLLRALPEAVEAALPDFFGIAPCERYPDGMDPPWAWFDPDEMTRAVAEAGEAADQALRRVADLERLAAERASPERQSEHCPEARSGTAREAPSTGSGTPAQPDVGAKPAASRPTRSRKRGSSLDPDVIEVRLT